MSDKTNYKHMVARSINGLNIFCLTDLNEPAIYNDADTAQFFCAVLRKRFPDCNFYVLSFQVL